VVDLGAWPGGWLQVAAQKVGSNGLVVGIDLQKIEDFGAANVKLVCGDARDEENLQEMKNLAGGKFDTALSDMSPKLSGIREVDSAGAVGCAELALYIAEQTLKEGGNLVIKLFKSNESEMFVKSMRPMFNKVKRVELDATRSSSNEFYVIGVGFGQ
jgi:23S rRNA (uridine2552-2'-O)-methyltransferase